MLPWLQALSGRVDADVLSRAQTAHDRGDSANDLLASVVPPALLLDAQSAHYRLPFLFLDEYELDPAAVSLVKEEVLRRSVMLPLFTIGNELHVATSDPDDLVKQDYLRHVTGKAIHLVLATRVDIEAAINRHFVTREKAAATMQGYAVPTPQKTPAAAVEVRLEDENAPVIKLVNYIIGQAINLGASDIHLERFQQRSLLRYRVDGFLHEFPAPPSHLLAAIVSRIKIMANLDVAERRLPQDGRATFPLENRNFDLRVSIIPNLYGEALVIRILDSQAQDRPLSELGMSSTLLQQYMHVVSRSNGFVLVTGPTGSGKSTTLYATLKQIADPRRKTITLEDPVEYNLDGVLQIPIQPNMGFTFELGLRSVLRHDPDTVMVGEIRDVVTAEIALRASMTGHFVFSTLHTNDAPSAVMRLVDMGVPAFLVLSSLRAVVAQRLLRRLCPQCKVGIEPTADQLTLLGASEVPPGGRLYGPAGCQGCNNLGYRGRVAVYELLEITPAMRRLPATDLSPDTLRSLAPAPYTSLRRSAIEQLWAGVASLDDVLTMTLEDE